MNSLTKSILINTQVKRRNINQMRENGLLLKRYGKTHLNKRDLKELKNVWGCLGIKFNHDFYTIIKSFVSKDFDPRYVSQDLFYPYILRSLNPAKYSGVYEHKGLYHKLLTNINQPEFYINAIGNTICDNQGNRLTDLEEIVQLLVGKSFIVKPTTDSACGNSVKAIHNATREDILILLDIYKRDFIVQEICSQSEKTRVFNPSSLNTFRVTTLFLNDKFSVLNILFRCGRGNVVVDNGGAGGLMCGCDTEGQLMPYALDNDLNKYVESSTGQPFGVKIPEVKLIIQEIERNIATAIPFCAFAGWDFALDSNNKPVMIEVNLGGSIGLYPGIFTEQLCNETPLFGDRTDEVINWLNINPPHIRELFM